MEDAYWKIAYPRSLKRLNIIDNTYVSKDLFQSKNLEFLGVVSNSDLQNIVFTEVEWLSFCWYWRHFHLDYKPEIYLFKFTNRLQKSHYETWIFGLFLAKNKRNYMCPLKRDSDYDFDVFEQLQNICRTDVFHPWETQ